MHHPDGTLIQLGPRQTKSLYQSRDIVQKLTKLKVGPKTLVDKTIWETEGIVVDSDFIEDCAIRGAGKEGVDWLAANGFVPKMQWFVSAINYADTKSLSAIAALGVDPTQQLADQRGGTLWHRVPKHALDVIEWLKNEGVDWKIKDNQGHYPVENFLQTINSDANLLDFYSTGMGAAAQGIAQILGPSFSQELAEHKTQKDVLTSLVKEMIKDGVPVSQKDLQFYGDQGVMMQKMSAQGLSEADVFEKCLSGAISPTDPNFLGQHAKDALLEIKKELKKKPKV